VCDLAIAVGVEVLHGTEALLGRNSLTPFVFDNLVL
jgi:hypothetical protein